ncbi:hypothetical protein JZU46_01240, partial [bacterium]|nr:hypothetical protein [bacterium]
LGCGGPPESSGRGNAERETSENSGSPVGSWMKRDDGAVSVGTRKGDEPGNGVGTGRVIEHGASR